MPIYSCDYDGCVKPAERNIGNCMICSHHFCCNHLAKPYHNCPSENEDPEAFYSAYDKAKIEHIAAHMNRINTDALVGIASKIRAGVPCNIPAFVRNAQGNVDALSLSNQMGGQNCNLNIQFEDGVCWLARVRLEDPLLPPRSTQSYISLSEAATLKFLEGTAVPAPKIFYSSNEYDQNLVGAPFILVEKLSGSPLDWESASPSQKTKVLEQLAHISLEISKHPFTSTGSFNSPEKVGPFAQLAMSESAHNSIGPFKHISSSTRAMVKLQQRLISDGELSSLPIDHYLSHCWRLDMSSTIAQACGEEMFFLKHFDDKGDHILGDEDHNITGVIDWEFASTEPMSLAFSTPCMLWPVADFCYGGNELAPVELELAEIYERLGRSDLADIVLRGRKMQRFFFFNGGGVATNFEEFKSLFQGQRAAWSGKPERQIESYESWKRNELKARSEDKVLRALSAL